jgi:hypothetical protein
MRNKLLVIVAIIAALSFTVQLFAGVNLTVTDRGNNSGWASIGYAGTGNDACNVSGFGLIITADSGAVFEPNATNSLIADVCDYNVGQSIAPPNGKLGYGIFPGSIVIDANKGTVTNYGSPVCPNTTPGAANSGPDTNMLVVEMGALYSPLGGPNQPPNSGTLISVHVNQDCNVCVMGEPIRGDVVVYESNGAVVSLTPSTCSHIHMPLPVVTSYMLTVTSRDTTGVAITVSPSDNNSLSNGSTVFNRYYPSGTVVTLTAPSSVTYGGSTYNFRQWDQDGNTAYAYTAATSLTMGASHTMQVEYECFPSSDPNYSNWSSIGKPICWCYARQCYGNASGTQEGKVPNTVWVGTNDLNILVAAWNKTPAQIAAAPEPNGCAEFSRAPEGKSPNIVAVGSNDLNILVSNWNANPAGNCVPGNRDPNNR